MSDLASLFPDLSNVLNAFDAPSAGTTNTLGSNPTVTDEDVERYITSQAGRILRPAVSDQLSPPTAEFARNGRPAPSASASYVEAPDPAAWSQETGGVQGSPSLTAPAPAVGTGQAAATTSQDPTEGADAPIPPSPGESPAPISTPPVLTDQAPATEPTGAPAQATSPPDSYDIGGVQVPRSQVEALVQFNQELAANPALRAHLQTFYDQQQAAAVQGRFPANPTFPPPQQLPANPTLPQPAQLPQLSADELADPAIAALYSHLQSQQAQLADVQRAAVAQQQAQQQQVVERNQNIVNSARAEFMSTYALTPELMAKVEQAASGSGAVLTYMRGMHPVTGASVVPNEYAAVKTALEMGFYAVPETRELDQSRRQQRAAKDSARRAKLGGVAGSGGSVSRTPPAAPDPRSAMLAEVGQMFNGTWGQ